MLSHPHSLSCPNLTFVSDCPGLVNKRHPIFACHLSFSHLFILIYQKQNKTKKKLFGHYSPFYFFLPFKLSLSLSLYPVHIQVQSSCCRCCCCSVYIWLLNFFFVHWLATSFCQFHNSTGFRNVKQILYK